MLQGFRVLNSPFFLYESNYRLDFPYFAQHSVDDEILIAQWLSIKNKEYQTFAKDNFFLEDVADFTHFVDETFSFFNTFYERLALSYANKEFLRSYYIPKINRVLNMRNMELDERHKFIRRRELARACFMVLDQKANELKASVQATWKETLIEQLNEIMYFTWRNKKLRKKRNIEHISIATGVRSLYDCKISNIIVDYYMEVHPLNRKTEMVVVDSDSE